MCAIYFHIPFCKSRCTYCDFFSQTNLQLVDTAADTMCRELILRQHYLPENRPVSSIYFGGGTPSLFSKHHFERIFSAVNQLFAVAQNAEITFEANPDDLTDTYFADIANLPFNRISIGIQSFNDILLQKINRRHTSTQAKQAVERAKKFGFNNISIDLIFGLPAQTLEQWKIELETALSLDIQHISAYGLTIEEGTLMWKQQQRGELSPAPDEMMNQMYLLLCKTLTDNGFEQYEISNFARSGYRSRHNAAYWSGAPYLGIGAAAHSFDGASRQWNVSSITQYINAIQTGRPLFEKEILTAADRYNEFVMTALRTSAGVEWALLEKQFGTDAADFFRQTVQKHIQTAKIRFENGFYTLTPDGILLSNSIISDLMRV